MTQTIEAETLLEAFFQERLPRRGLQTITARAEAAGEHQLAKIFRAVIASDGYREKRMHQGFRGHMRQSEDFYVCPSCGLIYDSEAPERCVADETPGTEFEHIS